MSWGIQEPVKVGDLAFGAIVETEVSVKSAGTLLAAAAQKRPLLIVLMHAHPVSGIEINGHAYEAEEIETLYPEAIEKLRKSLETAE